MIFLNRIQQRRALLEVGGELASGRGELFGGAGRSSVAGEVGSRRDLTVLPGCRLTMAAACPGTAVPVWLSEEDLSCIICQGLLNWPTTLPCGHSFCLQCLKDLWVSKRAGVDSCPWACPICRKGPSAKPVLHKNPLLQDLVDKYRQAALELEAGPEPAPAPRSLCTPTPPQVGSLYLTSRSLFLPHNLLNLICFL